jgi:hypothetical protein
MFCSCGLHPLYQDELLIIVAYILLSSEDDDVASSWGMVYQQKHTKLSVRNYSSSPSKFPCALSICVLE